MRRLGWSRRWHRNIPSVRFWSRPNQGAARTINEGIREARGRYLAILNSDDIYHPERLLRCVAVLETDPTAAVVATGISFVDERGSAIRYPWYEEACSLLRRDRRPRRSRWRTGTSS